MDINKHLKELNLDSIKNRDRDRSKYVAPVIITGHEHKVDLERFNKDGQMYCKECNEIMGEGEKIMNITPTEKAVKVKKPKKPKIANTKQTKGKKGFWGKLLGVLKALIFHK